MWRYIIPLENSTLAEFEHHFSFQINRDLRGFLLEHNGGVPTPGIFPTVARDRKLARLLDFSEKANNNGAWAVNARLRNKIGSKRIIIGVDNTSNFVCLEREHKQQRIVVWSHLSGEFEESLLDIPAFLRYIG